jgi:hypothetical protein
MRLRSRLVFSERPCGCRYERSGIIPTEQRHEFVFCRTIFCGSDRADFPQAMGSALWKTRLPARQPQIVVDGGAGLIGEFEPNGRARLFLGYGRAVERVSAWMASLAT